MSDNHDLDYGNQRVTARLHQDGRRRGDRDVAGGTRDPRGVCRRERRDPDRCSSAAAGAAPAPCSTPSRGSQGVTLVAMGDAFKDRLDESRAQLRKQHGAKIAVPDDRAFVGFDAYREGPRDRRELHHPRDAPRFPPAAPQGRGRGRQAHLHREARRGRRPAGIRTVLARLRSSEAEEPLHRRRHAAPAPDRLPRDAEAHPRRRDRRHRRGALLLEPGASVAQAPRSGLERHGVAAAQLAATSRGSPAITSSSSTSTTSTS